MNGPKWSFGWESGFEIRYVVAYPFSGGFVPPNLFALGIPGLAVNIAGSAIVKDTPIGRPRPSPIGIDTHAGGVFGAAALHLRAGFGPHAGVNPIAAHGGAVVFEHRKTGQLLARFEDHLSRFVVLQVRESFAIEFHGYLSERRVFRVRVSPASFRMASGNLPPSFL